MCCTATRPCILSWRFAIWADRMTEELLFSALEKLSRKLTIVDLDSDAEALLLDELEDAERTLLLYLRWDELTAPMLSKVVALAALYYQRDTATATSGALKSSSYSEDKVSQSESYLGPEDYTAAEQKILDSVAQYREVRVN